MAFYIPSFRFGKEESAEGMENLDLFSPLRPHAPSTPSARLLICAFFSLFRFYFGMFDLLFLAYWQTSIHSEYSMSGVCLITVTESLYISDSEWPGDSFGSVCVALMSKSFSHSGPCLPGEEAR